MNSKINVVIIDSNFILLPFQFKIDFFFEIREILEGTLKFIIFQQIFNELEAKKRREVKSTKFRRFLESGLSYLEKNYDKYPIEIINDVKNDDETTDEFLLKKANELKIEDNDVYLATNDSELRKKALRQHINTIFLRQKKYLSIDRA